MIDDYYTAVVSCINRVANKVIPCRRRGSNFSEYVVPGWSEYIKDKHTAAREAFLDWVWMGKPRFGPSFVLMSKTRTQFKLALRYCQQHEEMMRADALASHMASRDFSKFWKHVNKVNNSNATKFANVIDGCIGDDAITDRWYDHFKQLYNV